MAATLIDTNVLLRLLQPQYTQYSIATAAVSELRRRRADLCVATQNLVEFWAVATRPVVTNGLGMSPLTIAGELRERPFPATGGQSRSSGRVGNACRQTSGLRQASA